jgi:GNAT superfamily N-acetyltransferase
LVRTAGGLGPVVLLAGEFEEWVRASILADYGIDFEFKSERDLFLDLDGLLEPRARLYIAEINGEPVGIGGLRPLAANEAEIKRMYVRPSSRGLGVGRAILQRLIGDARARIQDDPSRQCSLHARSARALPTLRVRAQQSAQVGVREHSRATRDRGLHAPRFGRRLANSGVAFGLLGRLGSVQKDERRDEFHISL